MGGVGAGGGIEQGAVWSFGGGTQSGVAFSYRTAPTFYSTQEVVAVSNITVDDLDRLIEQTAEANAQEAQWDESRLWADVLRAEQREEAVRRIRAQLFF